MALYAADLCNVCTSCINIKYRTLIYSLYWKTVNMHGYLNYGLLLSINSY